MERRVRCREVNIAPCTDEQVRRAVASMAGGPGLSRMLGRGLCWVQKALSAMSVRPITLASCELRGCDAAPMPAWYASSRRGLVGHSAPSRPGPRVLKSSGPQPSLA